jgi:aminoglycoside 3-N-acetyltransferase I
MLPAEGLRWTPPSESGEDGAALLSGMDYTFEQLTTSNIELLKNLLRVFGEAFEDVETYQGAVPSNDYLGSLLAMRHFIVVVARSGPPGREVVGGLAAYELQKFERDRREIYIYDLAVAKEHRRKGVATGLIAALTRVATERGAYVIYVQADRDDAPAIALYQGLGTREDVHHFDFIVSGRSAARSEPEA